MTIGTSDGLVYDDEMSLSLDRPRRFPAPKDFSVTPPPSFEPLKLFRDPVEVDPPINPNNRLAGDVVPLPIDPGPNAGRPTPQELKQGQQDIKSGTGFVIQHPSREEWMKRVKQRL